MTPREKWIRPRDQVGSGCRRPTPGRSRMPDSGPQNADDGVFKTASELPARRAAAAPHPAGAGCRTAARGVQIMEFSKQPARPGELPASSGGREGWKGGSDLAASSPRAAAPHPEDGARCRMAARRVQMMEWGGEGGKGVREGRKGGEEGRGKEPPPPAGRGGGGSKAAGPASATPPPAAGAQRWPSRTRRGAGP
jgi:hypothetical protein